MVGGFTLGKWFVSLTGEVPLSSGGVMHDAVGKPTYKPTVKSEVTRRIGARGIHLPCELSSSKPGATPTQSKVDRSLGTTADPE